MQSLEPGKFIELPEVAVALVRLVLDGACRGYLAAGFENHVEMVEKSHSIGLATCPVGKPQRVLDSLEEQIRDELERSLVTEGYHLLGEGHPISKTDELVEFRVIAGRIDKVSGTIKLEVVEQNLLFQLLVKLPNFLVHVLKPPERAHLL